MNFLWNELFVKWTFCEMNICEMNFLWNELLWNELLWNDIVCEMISFVKWYFCEMNFCETIYLWNELLWNDASPLDLLQRQQFNSEPKTERWIGIKVQSYLSNCKWSVP